MKKIANKGELYSRIYDIVRGVPAGQVASYGQVAAFVSRCSPLMVGFAMAAVPFDSDVPWHRIINSKGKISPRTGGDGDRMQRVLLEAEGIEFDSSGRVNFAEVRWEVGIRL